MAFNASSHKPSAPAQKGQARGALTAVVFAEDVNRQSLQGAASPSPPEVGTVRDKIGRFSADSGKSDPSHWSPKDDPGSLARPRTPQHIAARLAAGRSPGPKDSTAAPRGIVSTQIDGGTRPRSLTAQEQPSLPAPTPLRRIIPKDILADNATKTSVNDESSPAIPQVFRAKQLITVQQRTSSTDSQKLQTQQRPTYGLPKPSVAGKVQSEQAMPALPPRTDTSNVTAPAQPQRRCSPASFVPSETNGSSPDSREFSKCAPTPSAASISARSQDNGSTNDTTHIINEDALSNAIVASTLASARVSPSKKEDPPPLPPQRRHRSRSLLHPSHKHRKDTATSARTSPHKGLRQTLREPPNSEDEEENQEPKYRKHYIRKHPHKHHEGDRKRWRSEITERERKRYEGVWAANKGILIPSPASKFCPPFYPVDACEMVLSLVVRDIWSRSRLPSQALEQVWNLVDRQGIGLLTREEFVVGLWLIDQYLKGHKIPPKVPDSIWDGVRHVPGLKPP